MNDLSIIIVTCNLKDYLRECLNSIKQHGSGSHTIQTIVVDNHSTDGTLKMLAEEFPGIRVITLPENRGFPFATNAGVRESTGKYVLLLNNDAKVLEGTLEKIIMFMENYPDVGCMGCRHYGPRNKPQLTWGKFPSLLHELHRKSINFSLRWLGPFYRWRFKRRYAGVFETDWVSGSCLVITREVIERIGLMDENILIYFEDIDWCTKVKKAGWKVVHHSNIPVFHYGGESARRASGFANYHYRVSQLYFWKKYYPQERVWFLRTLIVVRGVRSLLRALIRKLVSGDKPGQETSDQEVQYSKDTILLGLSGKTRQQE